jgi:hypothetical protein
LAKLSVVQFSFESLPLPSPARIENAVFYKGEKSEIHTGSLEETSDEYKIGRADSNDSVTSLRGGRTSLISGSGSEVTENHTRARLHALEGVVLSLTARLGMNVSEAPPPSYTSESE